MNVTGWGSPNKGHSHKAAALKNGKFIKRKKKSKTLGEWKHTIYICIQEIFVLNEHKPLKTSKIEVHEDDLGFQCGADPGLRFLERYQYLP